MYKEESCFNYRQVAGDFSVLCSLQTDSVVPLPRGEMRQGPSADQLCLVSRLKITEKNIIFLRKYLHRSDYFEIINDFLGFIAPDSEKLQSTE